MSSKPAKMAKKKKEKFDGLSPEDIAKIRIAIRKVWLWSYPRKLAHMRSIGLDGYYYCEKCQRQTPCIKIDHIEQVGDVNEGFIKRLFCPSSGLQALCKICHNAKTKEEIKASKINDSKKKRS